MRLPWYIVLTAPLVIGVMRCVVNSAGVETTNGATVVALESSITGQAPPRARISVFDSAYVPVVESGIALTLSADDSGRFEAADLTPGTYTVIVGTRDNGDSGAVFQGVRVGNSSGMRISKRLEPTGSLSGSIGFSGDIGAAVLVFLAGTGYYAVVSEPGPFLLESIVPGRYELQASTLFVEGEKTPQVLTSRNRKPVEILPGQKTTADSIAVQ